MYDDKAKAIWNLDRVLRKKILGLSIYQTEKIYGHVNYDFLIFFNAETTSVKVPIKSLYNASKSLVISIVKAVHRIDRQFIYK